MRWKRPDWSSLLRGGLIFMFMYAATEKILSPPAFANDLLKASYIRLDLVEWLIWVIPALEIASVVLLCGRQTWRTGLVVVLWLMSLFTLHLLIIWVVNPNSPCSCGGLIDSLPRWGHVTLNVLIIVFVVTSSSRTFLSTESRDS